MMLDVFLCALVVTVVEKGLRKVFFPYLGLYLGINSKTRQTVVPNHELERVYLHEVDVDGKKLTHLMHQLKLTETQIRKWLRIRKFQDRPTKMDKFGESCFKFCWYTISFLLGMITLSRKDWFWHVDLCWSGWPQVMSAHTKLYCSVQLGYYLAACYSHFTGTKRKDYLVLLLHHVIAFSMICLAVTYQYHRLGSLVAIVHDVADVFLEGSKCAKYSGYQKTCDLLLALFVVAWIVTRLYIYPFVLMRSFIFNNSHMSSLAYYAVTLSGVTLLILHVNWTIMIVQMCSSRFIKGTESDDVRSYSELSEDEKKN